MCGIYLTNKDFSVANILKRLDRIKYRGPDNISVKRINHVTLGHLRLSIIDVSARSNQPMSYENLHIVFNGEIYNYENIRLELSNIGYNFNTESDTEVLLVGYKHWGNKLLDKLNGMFAFAIYDSSTQKVFCARDRLGVKPFYYYWQNGEFEICSQIKPLINSNSIINTEAVSLFLDYGYIPSPFSIIENIYKLQPGKFLEIDINTKKIQVDTYWDIQEINEEPIDYEEAKSKLHELIIDATKIRLRSDVPLGSFLSGGIDSALISSISSKLSSSKLNTFTIGFEDKKYDESTIAQKYAQILKTNHIETICKTSDVLQMIERFKEVYDEPFADSSALPSLLLNSVTKKYATVALSGDGGDESFIGYNHFDSLKNYKKFSYTPNVLLKVIKLTSTNKLLGINKRRLNELIEVENIKDYQWKVFQGFDSLQLNSRIGNLKNAYIKYLNLSNNHIQQLADLNIKLWLENDSNTKVDRASMAFSVEVRSPFLDYRVIEFARKLPLNYRYKNGVKKYILKDILSEYIPTEVFNQPKKGFAIPLAHWLRNELRSDLDQKLNQVFLTNVPNLNIKKFNNIYHDFLKGNDLYTFHVWKLYTLALWYESFNNIKANLSEIN